MFFLFVLYNEIIYGNVFIYIMSTDGSDFSSTYELIEAQNALSL